jgi:peptidoglycan/xylan/chitin deacetylase (PgdA/CDA1 family)
MNSLFSPENRAAVRGLWTALRDLSRELRSHTREPGGHSLDPGPTPDAPEPWWRNSHTTAPSTTPLTGTAPIARAQIAHDPVVAPARTDLPDPFPRADAVHDAVPVAPARVDAALAPKAGLIITVSGKVLFWGSKIRTTSGKFRRSWSEWIVTRARDARRDAGIAAHEMRSALAVTAMAAIGVVRQETIEPLQAFRRMWTDARQATRAMAKAARVRMWTDATEALKAMSAAAFAAVTLAKVRSRLNARRAAGSRGKLAFHELAGRLGAAVVAARTAAGKLRRIAGRAAAPAAAKVGTGRAAAETNPGAGRSRWVAGRVRFVAGDAREAWRGLRGGASRVWATWRANGFGVPDVAKVSAGGIAVVAVILGIGYGAGHLGQGKRPAAHVTPSAAPSMAPEAALVPAVVAVPEAGPRVLPLSRFNPVTGPGKPPLPEDANGPQGSLKTTGTYEVALTFDDGPDPRWTPEVLSLLRQYRIKATFCVIGVNVVEFPELVREIDAEGHTLCNHSWGHDLGLGNRSYSTILSDMQRTNDAIRAAAPRARISYFRHPGGAWTQAAVTAARSLGMNSLHWDVDPKDWLKPGARSISTTVVGSTVPGSIVLMHDGGGDRRGTADALRSILPNLVTRFPLVALPPGVDPPKLYGIQLPVHAGQE